MLLHFGIYKYSPSIWVTHCVWLINSVGGFLGWDGGYSGGRGIWGGVEGSVELDTATGV